MLEQSAEISVDGYFANRRRIRHLFEVAPETHPDAFTDDAGAIGGFLYTMVRAEGDGQTDVRLLVDDGERYADLATDLARSLRCDVYLTPHGAVVEYVRESGFLAADLWDAMAVDRETGEPAQWLVIRPPDLPDGVPTWFVTTRGKLRQSNGLVTVTLPDGLAFATRATFRDTALLAGRMKGASSPVTTVAVNAGLGRFEISRFDAAVAQLGGVEFATLVGASLDTVHPDVQVALTWPADPTVCAALHEELTKLADALDRTVWVPQPQGAAFVMPGCGEFAAVDEVGGPSEWRAYPPGGATDWQPRYATDLDGRLVPADRSTATEFPGLAPAPGLYALDLAVLDDGRLGLRDEAGRELVVGPRELRRLLRENGWSGEDLLLLSAPTAEHWGMTIRHIRTVVDMLGVDFWLPAADAKIWVQAEGTIAADGPHGGWRIVGYGRSDDAPIDDIELPSALIRARRPHRPSPVPAPLSAVAEPEFEPEAVAAEEEDEDEVEVDDGHRVSWLPSVPTTNWRPMDVYVWTPLPTDHHEAWELPSADLFLLAGQDPLRLADRRRTGYLLRVSVPEETAVDLAEHMRDAPAAVRHRVLDTGGTHLLPLAWLADLRVTARYDLDGHGGVTARRDIDAGALAIRFEGADHGVPGLPNDVAPWPAKGQRTGTRAYLTMPEGAVHRRQVVHRGYVALTRTKPALEEGHRIVEVKVRQGRAIDVPATLDTLGGLPVAGRLHDFVGLDLLLPEDELAMAVATKAWRTGPTGKPVVDKLGVPLLEALAAEILDHAA